MTSEQMSMMAVLEDIMKGVVSGDIDELLVFASRSDQMCVEVACSTTLLEDVGDYAREVLRQHRAKIDAGLTPDGLH